MWSTATSRDPGSWHLGRRLVLLGSMRATPRRLRASEWRLLGLAAANAACIVGFLVAQLGADTDGRGGYRRIDVEAVQEKIRSGDLVRHEALWYHPEESEE